MSSSGKLINSSIIVDDSIVNADINSAAAIVASKLAAGGTANRVVATADGSAMALQQIVTAMLAANAATQMTSSAGTSPDPGTSSGTGVTVPEMTLTYNAPAASTGIMIMSGIFRNSVVGGNTVFDLYAGAGFQARREVYTKVAGSFESITIVKVIAIPSGTQTYRVDWFVAGAGGTSTAVSTYRELIILDLKR